jgi:hypothetical protein
MSGSLDKLVPKSPDQWGVLGLVCLTAGAVVWWSWPAWVLALSHWQLTLTLLTLGGIWAYKTHVRHAQLRARIVSALEDAPVGLTSNELVDLVGARTPPELVHECLRTLRASDAVEVKGVGGAGVVRYKLL